MSQPASAENANQPASQSLASIEDADTPWAPTQTRQPKGHPQTVRPAPRNAPRETTALRSHSIFASAGYWEEIDACKREAQIQNGNNWWQVGTSAGLAVGSVGCVFWLLRGTSLFTAALSTMPAWTSFDPLPVLEFRTKEAKSRKQPGDSPSDRGTQEEVAEDVFR